MNHFIFKTSKFNFYYLKRNECLECSWINLKYSFTFLLSQRSALVDAMPKSI